MPVTADTYAPFDDGPGANSMEDSWRKIMRGLGTAGVLQDVLDECEVYADGSGLQIKMRPGEVWLRGHWAEFVSEKTHPIATPLPPAGQERKDRAILRLDTQRNLIELDVLTGAPATVGSAVPPPVTETTAVWEIPLSTVPVPSGATNIPAGAPVDERRYMGQKPLVHRVRSVNSTLAVPAGVATDLVALPFVPHSDCHVKLDLNIVTEAAASGSGNFAEPADPVYGVRIVKQSDNSVLYSSDQVYRADCIRWNTPAVAGRSNITITNAPDVTLVRGTTYQLVVYGNRTTALGANLKHVLGTITECVQNTAS